MNGVMGQPTVIQAGSLVALRAQGAGEKRKREDASVIMFKKYERMLVSCTFQL